MGIISVLLFLLFGGLWGTSAETVVEPGFDDPLAEEFYALYTADTGFCSEYGKQPVWTCVDKKLANSDLVLVDQDGSDPQGTTVTFLHYVIRPDGSVTLYTEEFGSETSEWTRTECVTLATPRETAQACR